MLDRLIAFSVRRRLLVIVVALLVTIAGVHAIARAKYDAFPEFAPPRVKVQTEAPGLSPEQVEQLVTRPIEQALNGTQGVATLQSRSFEGLSIVKLTFDGRSDVLRDRQLAAERLTTVQARLPAGVHAPVMTPLTTSTDRVMLVGLTSKTRSAMALRTFADWTLKPALLGVPGVAKIAVFGGAVRQLQVQLLPDKLAAYGLTLEDVVKAARQATGVVGAGFIDTPNQRVLLKTEGQALTSEELGNAVIAERHGLAVRLADVANVVSASAPKIGDASVMGQPAVILEISGQYGSNTLQVTRALDRAIAALAPAAKAHGMTIDSRLFRPATFIHTALGDIGQSLLIGGALVAVVLFLFLLNWRTAFVSLTAIPLSLLIAAAGLAYFGQTLNALTIGGLAIAIGEVVDDAIVDVENIHRRLRENAAAPVRRPALRVVLDASLEVRGAVSYATFMVVLVFLPVLMMTGLQGRLFAPLGLAYVLAVLASLGVALTLTPALAAALLPERAREIRPHTAQDRLTAGFERILSAVMAHSRLAVGLAVLATVAALALLPTFGSSFVPELGEGSLIVHMNAAPGTSLQESMRMGRRLAAALAALPEVARVSQTAGRAELGSDAGGTQASEFNVVLKPGAGDDAQAAIRRVAAKFPGPSYGVNPYLSERLDEIASGSTSEVAVKIFGQNLDELDQLARQVKAALAHVAGVADLRTASIPVVPQLAIRLRPSRLAQFGFQPVGVMEAVQTAYNGTVVGQTYEGDRSFGVNVLLAAPDREDVGQVRQLMLRSPLGTLVPLGKLARFDLQPGRYVITHDGARRFQEVDCNVQGRDVGGFVRQARAEIARRVHFPAGTYAEFAGAAAAEAAAQRELQLNTLYAAVGVLLLLGLALGRPRHVLLVLANVPFALVGGVLAVFLTGGQLSLGALVGFVTLFGITARNALMLMAHYRHLVQAEGLPWNRETVLRGARERLRPILMTALVTGLGLLPIALGSGTPGREIEGPMAIVILGGLCTSTMLNLLLLPPLALRFARFKPAEAQDDRALIA